MPPPESIPPSPPHPTTAQTLFQVQVLNAPNAPSSPSRPSANTTSIFLAGSTSSTYPWRDELISLLTNTTTTPPPHHQTMIFNPLNKAYLSPHWHDHPSSQPFHDQVTWELRRAEEADIVVFWFEGHQKGDCSVSLLELGIALERARGSWQSRITGRLGRGNQVGGGSGKDLEGGGGEVARPGDDDDDDRSVHELKRVIVYCDEGYWKRGNVLMVCERYREDGVVLVEGGVEGLRDEIVRMVSTRRKEEQV